MATILTLDPSIFHMADFKAVLVVGSAKLTGSGGAVVALFPAPTTQQHAELVEEVSQVCQSEGFTLVKVEILPGIAQDL